MVKASRARRDRSKWLLTIIVPNDSIQIQNRLLFIAIFVTQDSLEDMAILKLNVSGRFVETHIVNLGEKNAK
jgi:hypothetical protein